jgi:hypothetical protein
MCNSTISTLALDGSRAASVPFLNRPQRQAFVAERKEKLTCTPMQGQPDDIGTRALKVPWNELGRSLLTDHAVSYAQEV